MFRLAERIIGSQRDGDKGTGKREKKNVRVSLKKAAVVKTGNNKSECVRGHRRTRAAYIACSTTAITCGVY